MLSGDQIAAADLAVVVDGSHAPLFTVIADQEGNEACVCTSLPPAQPPQGQEGLD